MSSMWPGMKWVWNEQSFAHGQAACWLSADRDRYKSWTIVGSLLVFGGSLMPLLSLSSIANTEEGTVYYGGEKERKRVRVRLYVCAMCVCVCAREAKKG